MTQGYHFFLGLWYPRILNFLRFFSYYPKEKGRVGKLWHVSSHFSGVFLYLEIATPSRSPRWRHRSAHRAWNFHKSRGSIFILNSFIFPSYVSRFPSDFFIFPASCSPIYEPTWKNFKITSPRRIARGNSKNLELPPYVWALGLFQVAFPFTYSQWALGGPENFSSPTVHA